MIADRLDEVPALIARSHELGNRARAREADVEAAGQQFALAYRTGVLGNYAMMLDAEVKANPQLVVNLPALALAHLQAGNREAAVGDLRADRAGRLRRRPARHAVDGRDGGARRRCAR